MRRTLISTAVLSLSLTLAACSPGGQGTTSSAPNASASAPGASSSEVSPMSVSPASTQPSATGTGALTLTSTAFENDSTVPREFTCDGANVSPPLAWTGVPAGTESLVLVVDDPDANGFVHWIVLDLPGVDGQLPKDVPAESGTPQQGTNGFGKTGWGGPCPPSGSHHYRFTLTALSARLGLDGHPDGDAVRAALSAAGSKVIGQATLTATYRRS
jgi:Raf kinase inhibitor-like YbhB/YbcL family protein